MRRHFHFLGVGVLVAALASVGHADGLSTPFADIEIPPVPLGHAQPVRDSQGHGLRIKNLGGSPVRVTMEILIPAVSQLHRGAQPIPDVHWIRVTPSVLELGAHEEKECDIVLEIPKQKAYGKHLYQAMIWSHGSPTQAQGVVISAGLLSKVRFRTTE